MRPRASSGSLSIPSFPTQSTMKTSIHPPKLLRALVLAVLVPLASQAAIDLYHADSVPVRRYYSATADDRGDSRYTEEYGTLYSDGTFIPSSAAIHYSSNFSDTASAVGVLAPYALPDGRRSASRLRL